MDILKKLALAFVLSLPLVSSASEAIDINAADQETLMSVKGIGEKRAAAIVAYRDQHGRFKSVDELIDVRGISESLVEKSRDSFVVKRKK